GEPATLTFEAAPGLAGRGSVGAVSPLPSVRAGLVRYLAQIAIEEMPETDLLPGMKVRAQIVTATHEHTLLVPSRAVHYPARGARGRPRGAAPGEDAPAVYVVGPDGRATRRTIPTGLSSGRVTEVVEGLAEGERVVVPPAAGG